MIGPLADSRRDTIGPWVFDYDLDETVTVLEGIRDRAGDAARVAYAPGIRPAQRTFPSMFDMCGDNAPADPANFDDDAELDRAVAARGAGRCRGGGARRVAEHDRRGRVAVHPRAARPPAGAAAGGRRRPARPVVLLVMNGRPLDLRWAAENVPAILDIWYPGTQGGAAVADLLFGDVAPGGKLPFSWPRTVGQVPMIYSPHHLPRAGATRTPLLGRGQHPAVPVRLRPELRPLRVLAT